ncbi:hypothetical protein HS125_02530 [bacterium]|nr:hypothetical protein [bacterium]
MTKRLVVLSLLSLCLGMSQWAQAFTHYRAGSGATARWARASAADIVYFFNQVGTPDIAGNGEFDVLKAALHDWETVSTSFAGY